MSSNKITAWAMWSIASVFYAYQYVLRVMPSILMPDIMVKYQIDPHVVGQLSGVYYIGYSLMHIPLGILLDRFGPKKIMPIFMILTAVGLLPFVIADFWIYPIIGRFFIGIGSSSAILGVFKIIRMAFDEKKFAWMLSLAVTVGLIGAIYGGAPLHYMRESFGFDFVVLSMISLGILLSVLTFLVFPNQPQTTSANRNILNNIRIVITNKMVLSICFLAGLMVGPLEGFADGWGSTFLKRVYGLDEGLAAGLPSMMYLGMCFGGPVLSLIVEKTKNEIGIIAMCAVIMCLAFIALMTSSPTASTLTMVFFIVGMLCAYQIIAIAHATAHVPPHVAGLTNAIANMIIMIFGYVFHSIIGKSIAFFNTANGTHNDIAINALIYGIAVIPISLGIAALGFSLLFFRKSLIKAVH